MKRGWSMPLSWEARRWLVLRCSRCLPGKRASKKCVVPCPQDARHSCPRHPRGHHCLCHGHAGLQPRGSSGGVRDIPLRVDGSGHLLWAWRRRRPVMRPRRMSRYRVALPTRFKVSYHHHSDHLGRPSLQACHLSCGRQSAIHPHDLPVSPSAFGRGPLVQT